MQEKTSYRRKSGLGRDSVKKRGGVLVSGPWGKKWPENWIFLKGHVSSKIRKARNQILDATCLQANLGRYIIRINGDTFCACQ